MDETLKKVYFVDDLENLSPMACAYARARGADRMSSYGDFVALSDTCDVPTAKMLQREVSDGIIAPDYTDEALEILKSKRKGTYNIIKIDPNYVPEEIETKQVFGITFEQGRNNLKINNELLQNIVTDNKEIPEDKKRDLLISLITLKYTQSNSVCYSKERTGNPGIGAGQQSRIQIVSDWQAIKHYMDVAVSPHRFLNLKFVYNIRRPDRDKLLCYISDEYMVFYATDEWQIFLRKTTGIY